jgi:hypothetical protein
MFYNLHTLCFCELSTEAEETAEHWVYNTT